MPEKGRTVNQDHQQKLSALCAAYHVASQQYQRGEITKEQLLSAQNALLEFIEGEKN